MEQLLNRFDKERIKTAMLKHEETFKEQVYELHRLYRIQKLLMDDMRSRELNPTRTYEHNFERPTVQKADTFHELNYHSKDQQRMQAKLFDLELPAEHYVSVDGEDLIEEESGIELTLCTGHHQWKKETLSTSKNSDAVFFPTSAKSRGMGNTFQRKKMRERINSHDWGVTEMSEDFESEQKKAYDPEERLSRHPWLVRVVSLNMT